MNFIWIIILSSLVSILGTIMGASIGIMVKNPSKKFLSSTMAFAGGVMLSLVVFDLVPEAIEKSGFLNTLIFYFIGILGIFLIENLFESDNGYTKIALVTALGLMIHNFPEGVIMGCGFVGGKSLGIKMSVMIAIHDIPEGLAVTAPLMAAKKNVFKILMFVFITAMPTAIGALIGGSLGNISPKVFGICLALASGIMIYVIFGELIPESNKLDSGILNTVSILLGVTLGLIMVNVL